MTFSALEVLAPIAVVWAGALLGTSATAVLRARETSSPSLPSPRDDDAGLDVLLVRPVTGADPWLEDALASAPRSLAPTRLRIRIAVVDHADPAHPIAVRAVARLAAAGFSATVCITGARGQNRKAAQIAAVLAREPAPVDAEREIVIVADADVDLSASPLPALLGPFTDGGIGAVWSPPVERAAGGTFADRASHALLGGSLHAFPLLAGLDEHGLVGKLCALRRSSLASVGGFEALIPWLGEDMRLAELLRERGWRFVATKEPAPSVVTGRSIAAVLGRYARWLQVIRAQRPWLLFSYPALFFGTLPASVLCVALGLLLPASWPYALGAGLVAARLTVALVAARAAGRSVGWTPALVDALLADALLAGAFVLATTQRQVAWKTNRFTFDRRGMLQEAEEAPRAIA